eukprot:877686_1
MDLAAPSNNIEQQTNQNIGWICDICTFPNETTPQHPLQCEMCQQSHDESIDIKDDAKTNSTIVNGIPDNGFVNNQNKKKSRKRKRSEMDLNDALNESIHESPPNKKHKLLIDTKDRKKHKKRKKKKKYDRHKWKSFKTQLQFGEDGDMPLRMCWHGSLMQPEANPLSNPRDCHICEKTISWDLYYHCDCNGIRTDWCYSHTRKLCISSPPGWKYVAKCVQRCNVIQRNAMVECLAIPLRNRVGAAITPDVKMTVSFKPFAGVSAPAPIALSPQLKEEEPPHKAPDPAEEQQPKEQKQRRFKEEDKWHQKKKKSISGIKRRRKRG